MERDFLFNTRGVEIYVLTNFLNDQECDHLCRLIESKHQRSVVSSDNSKRNAYTENRTSSSSQFDPNDEIVKIIEKRISEEVGQPLSQGEPVQGQLYLEGQEFKDHTDYFGKESFPNHCLASGQRTWTVMIYLNDVEAGGYTEFPEIGKSFAPQKSSALIWKNSDGLGTENYGTLHSGLPVVKGKKLIITKWFREKEYNPGEDERLANEYHDSQKKDLSINDKFGNPVKIEYVNGRPHARYGSYKNIPRITKEGFKKLKIPKALYDRIMTFYNEGRKDANPEFDPENENHPDNVRNFIKSDEVRYPTDMIPLTPDMMTLIFNELETIHKEWSGREIARTHCYGIRTYKRGATLIKHTDGFETRVISSILNIDQKVDEPWALQIDDHDGVEHEVFLEPGEMVLYESAILSHGRVKPFKGDYFSNLFVHFVNMS